VCDDKKENGTLRAYEGNAIAFASISRTRRSYRMHVEKKHLRAPAALGTVLLLLFAPGAGCGMDNPATTPGPDGGATQDSGGSGPMTGPAADAGSGGGTDSGSPSVDSGGPAHDAASGADAGKSTDSGANTGADAADGAALLSGRQVLVWIPTYLGSFSANLTMVTSSNPKAYTQVSPDFYNLNYAYTSGPPKIAGESFDGLSVAQVAQQVHAAGMQLIPLIYAGAGNSGTDQGIQNVISDSPPGTQNTFITAAVAEAQTRQYDGWNLDFEVSNTGYAQYGVQYVNFLAAFKAALHAQNMILTIDIADWYIRQCAGDGLVDLTSIGASVDLAIMEDYAGTYGSPVAACPGGTPPASQNCANEFGALMNILCDVMPQNAVSVGLIEGSGGSGANPFLDQALNAIAAAGFTSVAVWPDETPFLNSANIPNGGTWNSLLAGYLAGK
jgi:hypothetical protein